MKHYLVHGVPLVHPLLLLLVLLVLLRRLLVLLVVLLLVRRQLLQLVLLLLGVRGLVLGPRELVSGVLARVVLGLVLQKVPSEGS